MVALQDFIWNHIVLSEGERETLYFIQKTNRILWSQAQPEIQIDDCHSIWHTNTN